MTQIFIRKTTKHTRFENNMKNTALVNTIID